MYFKKAKDTIVRKIFWGKRLPSELKEMRQYFNTYGGIIFDFNPGEDGNTIAVSRNFRYGSIVTSGKGQDELDNNIKDAILTSFNVPSVFVSDQEIIKEGAESKKYAIA